MHKYLISDKFHKFLGKISKKDKIFYDNILNKINEIVNSEKIEHYKNLKYNMKDSKRVHIGHFVLIFRYDKKSNTIYFDDIKHHDSAYIKK
jgi:mRNA-degrading endonuclease RelE of RelBE toxin-antitoxin system